MQISQAVWKLHSTLAEHLNSDPSKIAALHTLSYSATYHQQLQQLFMSWGPQRLLYAIYRCYTDGICSGSRFISRLIIMDKPLNDFILTLYVKLW